MPPPRSIQDWVHWLEVGSGTRWIRGAVIVLGIALLSLLAGYKQFRGPLTETTFAQLVVGRQLAEGQGFTTPVRYPQTQAVLAARGAKPSVDRAWPELHQPPLYSLAVAAVLRVLPRDYRETVFLNPPAPPDGFDPDYVLLALNLVLLWFAAGLTYRLGRRLFDDTVGLIATFGLLATVSVWEQTASLNGTPLLMVVFLLFFDALLHVEETVDLGRVAWFWLVLAGFYAGALFLGEPTAAVVVLPVLLYLGFRYNGRRRAAVMAVFVLAFAAVATPWMWRNLALTGRPLALAGQGVVLKAGDPTADPAALRATLSAAAPAFDLNKFANKGLSGMKTAIRDHLWSGGGMFFSALFAVGLLYRFRNDITNRVRWLFTAVLFLLTVSNTFLDSGESERIPVAYAAPLIAVFGTGFFVVLAASSDYFVRHVRYMSIGLVALQAVPLVHDLAEPRRLHFNFPPYYPGLYSSMRTEMDRRSGAAWMADLPAGAAWYGNTRVWAQPAKLIDFYAIGADQPMAALVLTPRTLDKPFFADLARADDNAGRLGDWAQVYSGLVTKRFPAGFPLVFPQKVSDNLYVLLDPTVTRMPLK